MEAKKEKEIGYTTGDCCANCEFLAPTVWGEGMDSAWCRNHKEEVWIAAVCDSFEPKIESNE